MTSFHKGTGTMHTHPEWMMDLVVFRWRRFKSNARLWLYHRGLWFGNTL
jgi:hypothetical protein